MKRKALGKGLESLIPRKPPAGAPKPVASTAPTPASGSVLEIDLDRIRPNREQPRERFDPEALADLAASLRTAGVIQPVVVRKVDGERFELIAGERRWRAAQLAGLLRIPAVVREVPDDRLLEVALIENLQREELNAIEEAAAYRALIEDLELTQADVAERVGKNRATVSNALRLLTLAKAVQERVRSGAISAGHARALAGLSSQAEQVRLAERVEREDLSVRDVERLVARGSRQADGPGTSRSRAKRDPNVEAAEERLQQMLGTRVRIVQGRKGAGRLELHFYSEEELQRLYDVVAKAARTKS